MKFTLPLSPSYCEHWGLWEAVREIYQNALDAGDAVIAYYENEQSLILSSKGRPLDPSTLVLGTTSKRDNKNQRGKFGEGYKLALLVLTRLKHDVVIRTGRECWAPVLEHDSNFNATVLNIYTDSFEADAETVEGAFFRISEVRPEDHDFILSNIRPHPDEDNTILDEEGEAGRIYAGGLYVTTVKGFKCGYSFRPDVIKLDRDRGMVDGFDLAWETSKLWTAAGHSARLSELLESEAPDVEYVESHVNATPGFADAHFNYFVSRHGFGAVPVSTQEEIQRASAAGMKWVLVPEKVKAMLRNVKHWFIPNSQPLIERLKEFRNRHRYYLTNDGKQELDEIIQSLEQH